MNKLFATNFANVDYSQIEREYGSVVQVMTTGFIDLSTESGKKNLYDKIMPLIKSASPEDLLVLSGSSVITTIIVHYWLKYHGIVRMLAFNRRLNGGTYTEIIFPNIELSPDNNQPE